MCNIDLVASYTYLDTAVTRSTTTPVGNRPVAMPNHVANAYGEYGFHEGRPEGMAQDAGIRFVGCSGTRQA